MPGTRIIRELRANALSDSIIVETLMRELQMSDDEAREAISRYDERPVGDVDGDASAT